MPYRAGPSPSAPPRRQGGLALLLFVVLLAGVASLFIGAYTAELGGVGEAATQRRDQDYVNRAATLLAAWYAAHPQLMDGSTQPSIPNCSLPVGDCLMQAAGIPERHGVVVSVGPRQTTPNGYDYRSITLWIPKPDATGSQRTQYAAQYALVSAAVDGRPIERALWVEANRALARLSAQLVSAYAAWLANTGDIANDWFQPTGCGPYGDNANFVCADTWTNLAQSGLPIALGAPAGRLNPWGLPYQICNAAACGASDQGAPYSLLLRTATPWGGLLSQTAIEPIAAG
ncbi:hypothetical protein [Acidihalobacter prosperus]|uniref:hypothetical protein n=1 Tax=Acidihalobacter prosperus TaxID=160660 RepID=UPI0007EE5F36|nr:hypothetical protein [Acidihalobacter prosperus]